MIKAKRFFFFGFMYEWYEDETDDHEEEPCEYFFYSYRMPGYLLSWIYPDSGIGCYIFCYPDKKCYQRKSKSKIHRVCMMSRCVVYLGSTKCYKYEYEKYIPYIIEKMMGKKVYINTNGYEYCIYFSGIIIEFEVKNPPYPCNVASNCWIHKSCKKWNRHNSNRKCFRVIPWPDRWMCFKYLHSCRDNMEYEYYTYFTPWLKSSYNKKYLKYERRYKKKVISVYDSFEWIIVLGDDDHEEEKTSKYAGICLLVDECNEVLNVSLHMSTIEKSWKIAKSIKNIKIKLTIKREREYYANII